MSGYTIAQLDEIDEISDGRSPLRPVRHHFGIRSFGINSWTAREAGDRIINEHDEADEEHEELYYVARGRATFELDGERCEVGTGAFVFVEPNVKRTAFAEEPGTTIVAVGGTPGKPYEVFGWELWAPVRPLYEAKNYEEAAERMRPIAAANPQYPILAYNLACLESLLGRNTDALEHLQRAIEESDRFREYAKSDSDLDALREEPRFKELVGARESAPGGTP
jgi:hypothetical protein